MFISLNNLGSMVLDVNGNSLDAKFVRENGAIADSFRIVKGVAGPATPAAPSNLVATTFSTTQINVSWTDNSADETGFRIERCTGAGCTDFTQVTEVAANVTTFANSGLTKNTTYTYRVRAFNAGGNSAYSNVASAKTLNKLPRGRIQLSPSVQIESPDLMLERKAARP
jgi:predicted phage tail protein